MLKHVQISPQRQRADSVSLRSLSISCDSSLCGSPEPPADPLRPVSRASSYCSLSESQTPPQATIKIYTACLRIDIEYKTLGIQWDTTSKEVVAQLLRRCKLRQRDPRLFYLSMEVTVRRAGVKTLLALDDGARPATLQACHPKGDSRFCLQMKPGGLVRVHTSVLQPTSQYKSLLIAEQTTADELLQLLLTACNSADLVEQFSLYEVCAGQEYQRKLHPDDQPLRAQQRREQSGERCHFLVRRNPHYPRRRHMLLAPIIESAHASSQSSLAAVSSNSFTVTPPATPTAAGFGGKTTSSHHHIMTADSTSEGGHQHPAVCKMCKNHFRSCEFCHKTVAETATATSAATPPAHQQQTFPKTPAVHFLLQNQHQQQHSSPSSSMNNNTSNNNSSTSSSVVRRSLRLSGGGGGMATELQKRSSTYNPVYNVREIAPVGHPASAFGATLGTTATAEQKQSSFGNDDVASGGGEKPSASSTTSHRATASVTATATASSSSSVSLSTTCSSSSSVSGIALQPTSNNVATTNRRSSIVGVCAEAVNNDPANGYGKFVYI